MALPGYALLALLHLQLPAVNYCLQTMESRLETYVLFEMFSARNDQMNHQLGSFLQINSFLLTTLL